MKKQLIIASAISAAFISASACAMSEATAQTGITVGAQAGFASFQGTPNVSQFSAFGSVSSRDGGFFTGVNVGYDVALSKAFEVGAEIGVANGFNLYELNGISPFTLGTSTISYSDFSVPIMLKAQIVMPFGLNVFVKGGIAYHKYTEDNSGVNPNGFYNQRLDSYSKWAPELALGVGYQIKRFNIFVQYTQVFGNKFDQAIQDKKAISTGIITGGISYTLPA